MRQGQDFRRQPRNGRRPGRGWGGPSAVTDGAVDTGRRWTVGGRCGRGSGRWWWWNSAVSAAWQWTPCGTLPPTVVSAKAVAYAPLTEELAAAYADGRVILHSVDPATADRVLSQTAPAPTAIAFSPDGKVLAEARTAAVSLRRLQDGQVLAMGSAVAGACGTPTQLSFSPDGSRLLGWSGTGICVWGTDTGALVAAVTEAFTTASLTNSGVVVGRRLSTGRLAVEALSLPALTRTAIPLELAAAPASTEPETLVISPTGDRFVALVQRDTGRSLTLWGGGGELLLTRPLTEDRPVVFSPDGRHLLLSDVIVNARTGAVEGNLPRTVSYQPVMLNTDGTRLAAWAAIRENQVPAVYDAVSGGEIRVFGTLPGPGASMSTERLLDMSMSANGQLLATSDVRNLMVFRIGASFPKIRGHFVRRQVRAAVPDHPRSGRRDAALFGGWVEPSSRTSTGEVLDTLPPPPEVPFDNCTWTLGSLSPRSTWLVIAPYGRFLNIRNTQVLSAPGTSVPSARCNGRAAFNADETLMATTGPELYRIGDWTRLWPATISAPSVQNKSPFGDVQFLPGGRELLVSSCGTTEVFGGDLFNCSYALHAADSGQKLRELPVLTAHKAAVSPEGHWIVSGATLQHLPTGTLRNLELDAVPARLSIFAPNGDIIADMPDNTLVRYCRSNRAD